MSYSFSADAVQYGRDSAYYVRDITDGGTSVVPGNLEVTGDLTVEGASELTGSVSVGANLFVAGVLQSGNGARLGAALPPAPVSGVVIGNSPNLPVDANSLLVTGRTVSLDSVTVQKSDAIVVVNTTGTAIGTIDAFAGPGGAPLLLNANSTEPVGIGRLGLGSLQSIPPTPVPVDYLPSPWGGPSGTLVIAGVRFMWGNTNFGAGAGGTLTFSPAFSGSPCVTMVPQNTGSVNGFATIRNVTAGTAGYALTTDAGAGFETNAYWMAIGPA